MRYLSVCSGIEAATVAWHDLGWKPVGFSEIEKFPSQVLAHHYPDVPNLGDMTKYKEWDFGTDGFDILVGGTPCQSFSVAGLRKGLEDPRGNLMLTYVGILDHFRPKWCVWENVPGVLSSNGGRDFGSFLGALVELGYGFAYRVLDAKNFGVPQRRRRVFVVGCLGDWESAAKVLFEPGSLCRDSKESAPKGQGASAFFESSLAQYRQGNVAGTLKASGGVLGGGSETFLTVYENHPADSRVKEMGDLCQTVTSRWGTGGGNVPLVQVGVDVYNQTIDGEVAATLTEACGGTNTSGPKILTSVSYAIQGNMVGRQDHNSPQGDGINEEVSFTLNTIDRHAVSYQTKVRRLTPIECERLQGFPDNYTNIPWNGKAEAPDGHRYKALGNSMAVPVMQWIGDGIDML